MTSEAERSEQELTELIELAATLDREAFGTVYQIYAPRIHRYISYQIGDQVAAEDLTNQVFLRAMQAIGRYEHRSVPEFNAWLYRIARNVVVDNWRGRRETDVSISRIRCSAVSRYKYAFSSP